MCGIVALLTPDLQVAPPLVDAMRDRLAHRGPDGAGTWIERRGSYAVALAHRRLSIIDLSDAAKQPMFGADGRVAITYNGEIYNYIELRSELAGDGMTFRTGSDTEVLIAAYLRWGVECLPRLNGMFAFAIWDSRCARLFVARDRFGEKPLFYARPKDGGIAFASEMKALFAHPGIAPAVHQKTLDDYCEGRVDYIGTDTFFDGVQKVPSASAMLLAPDGTVERSWRYWTPDYITTRPVAREGDVVEEFRHRLSQSLKMRLRSDVRVGACLSGGLDSSTLVGMLAGLEGKPQEVLNHTISARFDDDPTMSEGPYIDLMLAHVSRRGEFVTPRPAELAAESLRLHWHHEEPVGSASTYLEWCVMKRARQTGCPVMIDGQGSDELLGGYQPYFRLYQFDLMRRMRWMELYANTRRFSERMRAEASKYVEGDRRFNARIAYTLRELWSHWRVRSDPDQPTPPGVPPSRGGRTFRWQRAYAMLYESLALQMHSADRNAMAFGVESRFPFLDHTFVDWCIGLTEDLLIRDGWQKYVLRRAAAGLVAPEIQWRVDKVGFAAPQDAWLRGPLRDWARERLFEGPLTSLAAFSGQRTDIEAAWNAHQSGAQNASWQLWKWISLSEWLELSRQGWWKKQEGPAYTRNAIHEAARA
jgi:asparagine synthase (glutamine-hydrolysing)